MSFTPNFVAYLLFQQVKIESYAHKNIFFLIQKIYLLSVTDRNALKFFHIDSKVRPPKMELIKNIFIEFEMMKY